MAAAPLATGINLALLALLAQEPRPGPLETPDPIVVAFELAPRDRRIRPRNLVSRLGAEASNALPSPAPPWPQPSLEETESGAPSGSLIDPEWQVNRGAWGDPQGGGSGLPDLRQALRARQACLSNAPLTAEDKERCRAFWDEAAARGQIAGLARPLNLDPRGTFAKEAEPYLQRRPHNGCKPRAGGSVSPAGEVGVATGLSCAFSF